MVDSLSFATDSSEHAKRTAPLKSPSSSFSDTLLANSWKDSWEACCILRWGLWLSGEGDGSHSSSTCCLTCFARFQRWPPLLETQRQCLGKFKSLIQTLMLLFVVTPSRMEVSFQNDCVKHVVTSTRSSRAETEESRHWATVWDLLAVGASKWRGAVSSVLLSWETFLSQHIDIWLDCVHKWEHLCVGASGVDRLNTVPARFPALPHRWIRRWIRQSFSISLLQSLLQSPLLGSHFPACLI